LVFEEQNTIKEAGRILELKKSTAKMIIKKYRQTGFITKFKTEKKSQRKLLRNEIKEENQIDKEEI
jgi:predicted transcriptional regulator